MVGRQEVEQFVDQGRAPVERVVQFALDQPAQMIALLVTFGPLEHIGPMLGQDPKKWIIGQRPVHVASSTIDV
jgi:hypothetical protein